MNRFEHVIDLQYRTTRKRWLHFRLSPLHRPSRCLSHTIRAASLNRRSQEPQIGIPKAPSFISPRNNHTSLCDVSGGGCLSWSTAWIRMAPLSLTLRRLLPRIFLYCCRSCSSLTRVYILTNIPSLLGCRVALHRQIPHSIPLE